MSIRVVPIASLLVLASCSEPSPPAAANGLEEARAALRAALEGRGGAVLPAAENLLAAGENEETYLLAVVSLGSSARRPDLVRIALGRMVAAPAPGAKAGTRHELWMTWGRTCALLDDPGTFFASFEQARTRSAPEAQAALAGLRKYCDTARACGRAAPLDERLQALVEADPGAAAVLGSVRALLGTDLARYLEAEPPGIDPSELEAGRALAAGDPAQGREALLRARAAAPSGSPAWRARTRDLISFDLAVGAAPASWNVAELPLAQGVRWLAGTGRHAAALELLDGAASRDSEGLSPAELQGVRVRLLRESGRGEEAAALLARLLESEGNAGAERIAQLELSRARVLLDLGRGEEARAILERLEADPELGAQQPGVRHLSLAFAELMAGRVEAARARVEAALRVFPATDAEIEQVWGPALFLLAPRDAEAGIALTWTRFPRLRDNDASFFAGIKALLEGRREEARGSFATCLLRSVGGEYPQHLAAAFLNGPVAKDH